jgi:hypothetical protein
VDDEVPPDNARVLKDLRDDLGPEIVRVGSIPMEILRHWSSLTTLEVVITRERRTHYLARHPEILRDEPLLLDALMDPLEVHRNRLDERIAILYKEVDDGFYLRVPVWISDRTDRQNSVLSLRRARSRDVDSGRSAGRQVWRKVIAWRDCRFPHSHAAVEGRFSTSSDLPRCSIYRDAQYQPRS